MFTGSIKYYKHGDTDMVFDERGSSFLAMRNIQWAKEGVESDPEKGKLELRKWTVDKDGAEVPMKGFSFLTEEGPHNLVHGLIEHGYGDTRTILNTIAKREDFREAVTNRTIDPDQDSDANGEKLNI